MSACFPITQLLVSPAAIAVAVSGPHIHVLDSKTGNISFSTTSLNDSENETLLKAGPVRSANIDSRGRYIATLADDKKLRVWELGEQLKLLNEREIPKKSTCVHFTADSKSILVSDKFGDVFSYPLHLPAPVPAPVSQPAETSAEAKKGKGKGNPPVPKNSLVSHPSTSNGQLILGHASLLTTFVLTSDEKYIITADRDEHIRVSWFPQGYTIESFCLGSSQYVSALHIPPSHPDKLISGGGDPELKVWDWKTGSLEREIPIIDAVKDFLKIKVKASARRKWGNDENDGEGDRPRRRGKGKKGKGKEKADEADADVQAVSTDRVPEPSSEQPQDAVLSDHQEDEEDKDDEDLTVLVVNKIHTLEKDSETHIVFSVVGGTALFNTRFSEGDSPSKISHYDFGKPILDFTVFPDDDGLIWVSVEPKWSEEGADSSGNLSTYVYAVQLSSEKLEEVPYDSLPHAKTTLWESLNTTCLTTADSWSDLGTLDLYSPLLAYPKNTTVLHNPMDQADDDNEEPAGIPDGRSSSAQPVSQSKSSASKKQLGRLKNKRAVLEKQKKLQGGGGEGGGGLDVDEEEEHAKAKRTKSDDGVDGGEKDIVMEG